MASKEFYSPFDYFYHDLAESDELTSMGGFKGLYGFVNTDGYLIQTRYYRNSMFGSEDENNQDIDDKDVYLKEFADKYFVCGEVKAYEYLTTDAITLGDATEVIITKRDDIPEAVFYEYPDKDTSLGLETIEFTEWPADLLPAGFPNQYELDGVEVLSVRQEDTGIIIEIAGRAHDTWDYYVDLNRKGNFISLSGEHMISENGDYVYIHRGWVDECYPGGENWGVFNPYTVDTFQFCPFNDKVITE